MLTWILIFVVPGSILFGVAAWLWRHAMKRRRVHMLLALPLVFAVWALSMVFGHYLFLDVMHAGSLGRAQNAGAMWSVFPALLTYRILRKREHLARSEAEQSAGTHGAVVGSIPASPPSAPMEPGSLAQSPAAVSEECFWAEALAEFESTSRRPGLWAKSLAESQGSEAMAKAIYLRHRAAELDQELRSQIRSVLRTRGGGESQAR